MVGARPVEQKKGADGKILFRDHPDPKEQPQAIIFSVKGGGVDVKDVRRSRHGVPEGRRMISRWWSECSEREAPDWTSHTASAPAGA